LIRGEIARRLLKEAARWAKLEFRRQGDIRLYRSACFLLSLQLARGGLNGPGSARTIQDLEFVMAQVCEICGKGPQFGNNISHAHNVTRRRWNPNLQSVKAVVNGVGKRVRVCTTCIKAGKVLKG
jgi:large subunit ribosomal protein L28